MSINTCHAPLGMIHVIVHETVVSLCLHVNQLLTGSLQFVNLHKFVLNHHFT